MHVGNIADRFSILRVPNDTFVEIDPVKGLNSVKVSQTTFSKVEGRFCCMVILPDGV